MTIDTELEVTRLREALSIANLTIGQLKAELREDQTSANSWLQRKVLAQAKALTRLNERVCNQRFTLRSLEELGRGLSSDELTRAREADGRTVALVGVS